LIVVMLFGSTAWPDVCARRANCCAGGACQMKAGGCHEHQDAKSAVMHYERATMMVPPAMRLPDGRETARIASVNARLLTGVDCAPDRPPRIDSPSR